MTFYEKIIQELETQEQSLSTVYHYAFRFSDEALFEWDENGQICTLSYGEAQKQIEHATAALHQLLSECVQHTPVGIYLPNSPSWVISFWAILRAGFYPLLLNTNAPKGTAERCVYEAGANYVISDKPLSGIQVISPDELVSYDLPDYCNWADEVLLCTSGTTGDPQVVAFDGHAICAQIRNSGYVLKHNRTVATFYHGHIKLLAFLPFYHIFGLSAVLLWFSCFGRTLVLLPSFSPEAITRTCQLHEVTHVFALPIFWNAVADGVLRAAKRTGQAEKLEKGIRLSLALQNSAFPLIGQKLSRVLMRSVQAQSLGRGVRFCITGGGPIRNDTLRLINGIGYPLRNGYGMTEIGIASVDLRHKASERMEGSIGKLFPSIEARITDDQLIVRGKTCFCAQYRRGTRIPHDPQSWFNTEDCISVSGEYLFFSGRKDEMLNSENGERISPAAIEAAFGCPQISQLCVLSMLNEKGKNEAALIVEPKQYNAYALGLLSKQLYEKNDSLPSSYRVGRILFSQNPLPLASTMKVQVSAIRKQLEDGSMQLFEAQRSPSESEQLFIAGMDELLPRVIKVFQDVSGIDEVTADSHFQYDLGGDSLLYMSLLEHLSDAFHISFDAASDDLATPRAVAVYILKEND